MKSLVPLITFFIIFSLKAETKLIFDRDYFSTLNSLLSSTKHSVKILSFSFATDDGKGNYQINSSAYKIASKLIELKKSLGEQVTITLYLESERSTSNRNKLTGDLLLKNGIVVKYGSTHAKGIVVDDKVLLFGSTNLTNQSLDKNNETNILTDDISTINEFNNFFNNLYSDKKFGSLRLNKPMFADGDYKNEIINLVHSANKSIQFSIYYFNDSDIENAIINAYKRGVKISGVFNSLEIKGSHLVDKNNETIKRLNNAGLNDLHLALDDAFTHSKYIIADNKKFLLGTGNWNVADYSIYRQLYIKIEDLKLAKILSEHFQTLKYKK